MIVIKEPEEQLTDERAQYIQNFVVQAMNCVRNKGRDGDGKFVLFDYFDEESTVRYFMMTVGLGNGDAYRSSTYLYKPEGIDKLYFGPIWDCDFSMGSHGIIDNSKEWLLSGMAKDLIEIPEFRQSLQKVYQEEMKTMMRNLLNVEQTGSSSLAVSAVYNEIESSGLMNQNAWLLRGSTDIRQPYTDSVKRLERWIDRRYQWLNQTVCSEVFTAETYPPVHPEQQGQLQDPAKTEKEGGKAEPKKASVSAPGKPEISVTARKGKLRISWKKVKDATGYQVRYQKYGKKQAKFKTTKNRALWIKKLKRRTKYTVQVRAYRQIEGHKYCGKWSEKVIKRVK